MQRNETLLADSGDMEKGAYLGAIASIATADRQATPEEMDYLSDLADAAELSSQQKEAVLKAASEITGEDVLRCLDVLKTSDLKYSLVADLIAFAKTDNHYSPEEQDTVQKMSDYLGVSQHQFSVLDEFTEKAKSSGSSGAFYQDASNTENSTTSNAQSQQAEPADFLSSLGIKEKLERAGISGSGLLKGLLGIAGPLILAKMVSGGRRRSRGMFGGGGGMPGGGLGSIFSMLGGGRGYGNTGGLLRKIFGGRL